MATPSQQPNNKDNFRPPFMSALYGTGWACATYQLCQMGLDGAELASAGSLVTGGLAIGQGVRAMTDQAKVKGLKRKRKRYQNAGKKHGQSKFATPSNLRDSDDISHKQGVFIGQFKIGRRKQFDVFLDGTGHLSVIAPPGENKTMAILVTTILNKSFQGKLANVGESMLINDPTGEIYAICKEALESANYEVLTIAPFAQLLSQKINLPITDCGLNILSAIRPDMDLALVRSELAKAMKWAMPGQPKMTEKDEYFYRLGRRIGEVTAMSEMIEGRSPTLGNLRKRVMQGPAFLHELCEQAENSTAFGGSYKELSQSLSGLLTAAPQQLAGGYGVVEQSLDLHDNSSAMGRHTTSSTLDPKALKDPTKKTALFVMYGNEKMETHAAPIAMTLNYLFDSIAADKQKGCCLALIDEVGGLNMPKLASSLNFYRKEGLRCVMAWQDLSGQAEATYGRAGVRQIMAASKYKVFMGLQEPETLSLASKLCGTQSVDDMSMSDQSVLSDAMPEQSHDIKHTEAPLFRPEEIRTMPSNKLLMIGGNLPPVLLDKVCYWERKAWNNIAGNSPYYRG